MFDRDNNPESLQSHLELFMEHWLGDRKPWFGIAAEKIAQTRLPKPLAWLYGYAGEWHGQNYWDTLLGNQDCLIRFEDLWISNGKLIFICENQGVWQVGTEPEGDDPAVWVRSDDGPWHLLEDSLTRFLVTFVLHETFFSCRHVASSENMTAQLTAAGMHISPLWLDHPYPMLSDTHVSRPLSFHVANGTHLIMNDCLCATNSETPWDSLPAIFQPTQRPSASAGFSPYDPIPEHLQIPSFIRKTHLQRAIRRHEAEVEYHQGRCTLYRNMLANFEDDKAS